MRDQVAEVKELRDQGLTYKEIGEKLKVSSTMARVYATGNGTTANNRKPERENAPYVCRVRRPDYTQTCQRTVGHKGIHLSDEEGKLIWW